VWCSWDDDHTYVFDADQADLVLASPADEKAEVLAGG
jgi:hypothetical protein